MSHTSNLSLWSNSCPCLVGVVEGLTGKLKPSTSCTFYPCFPPPSKYFQPLHSFSIGIQSIQYWKFSKFLLVPAIRRIPLATTLCSASCIPSTPLFSNQCSHPLSSFLLSGFTPFGTFIAKYIVQCNVGKENPCLPVLLPS